MRHVPDEELHAYLDQALSRSQCVEIETHLAACARCSDRRDATAALRDRTTALLGQLAPRGVIVPPPYHTLEERRIRLAPFSRWQQSLRRSALWAAGIAAAVGTGWAGRSLIDRPATAPVQATAQVQIDSAIGSAVPLTSAPSNDFGPVTTPLPLPDRTPREPVSRSVAVRHVAPSASLVPPPVFQLVSSTLPSSREAMSIEPAPLAGTEIRSPFARIWRRLSWEEALQVAGSALPFIEGMPVLGVLFQPGSPGERPTVIVAQQDASGEVIQSIEGPVDKVTDLLRRQATPDTRASALTRTPPDYIDEPGGVRRANRILTVTGRLTVDSLNALARLATIR